MHSDDFLDLGMNTAPLHAWPKRQPTRWRIRHGATLLGISEEAYALHREQGEAWCSQHRAWEPQTAFGTVMRRGRAFLAGDCRQGAAERSAKARKKAGG